MTDLGRLLLGLSVVAVGALFLLDSAGVLDAGRAINRWWPLLILAAGHGALHALFAGPKLTSTSQTFRGGWLTAVFGGVTLDLRNARPAPEGASINATVAFGGIEILVPRGWRIDVRSTPIFGGVDDKTDHSVPPGQDAPTLRIDAVAVFGGVDVKHDK